ncbi:Pathogenesis-related transcriptional factor and ERF protein [Flammeovirga aprica]|uniref:Pathogenesis-related transcriptional factor and ERF protein n=1 Tax=Flammeovirga aprica JL-4 TaxID=694437 RepID=A0A7X9P2F6_9BACT|nr:Pathogenesis-related transcriptional factor and ERF protein [Flammeovirga aprica]NME68333.1 Pathogenesis-related transcriptional factor and ERF protein [Flammeovirga aprica JL-4]
MLCKIKLKNTDESALISVQTFEFIEKNEYYKEINLLENLRKHVSGYIFFQKNYPTKDGKYQNVTIYLHKLVAETFVEKPESDKRLFVRNKNGNSLDCREENLEWVTMADLRRHQNHRNKTGYRGVVQVSKNSFRAVLYSEGKRHDLGVYKTAQEAADVYNKYSEQLFGETKGLNRVHATSVKK